MDYTSDQGADYHAHRRLPPASESWLGQVRAEKIQPYVAPSDRVFEYGVGFGWNLMAVNCAAKSGFDVAPGLSDVVEARGIKFIRDLAQVPEAAFDVVLAHHTLEHLPSPLEGIRRMLHLLRSGGKLLLFVPFERERKYRRYNPANKAHHLYSWTPASFARLVAQAGASVQKVEIRKFRFDRLAAVITKKLHGNAALYRALRFIGLTLFPEYEISLLAKP